ncbi:glycoside hydrolase domain-containing protein [Clostridium sartagoforme]
MVKWIKNADGFFEYDYTYFDKWVTFNLCCGTILALNYE